MDSAETSAMFLPERVTPSVIGLSLVPLQVGHGTSRMKPSNRSREVSESASACLRRM